MPPPVKSLRPEDAELTKKLEELSKLQPQLADLELQLFNLRLELSEFESLYCAKVGPAYAELDELNALIAEYIAQQTSNDPEASQAATAARRQANESHKAVADAFVMPIQPIRSDSLRELYKSAAKRLHPDLARDDIDRKIRERLMTEVNLAYARGDEKALRAILDEYDSSPDTVLGSDIAAELVRAIRRISLARKRIEAIEIEIHELKTSELCKLKTLVENGKKQGTDVLRDMLERINGQIQEKRKQLQNLQPHV
ncbi:MAG TPA: hypothetical protein VGK22_06235 [Candidatus Angelobacter sp.]|jgi:hypothetical protein